MVAADAVGQRAVEPTPKQVTGEPLRCWQIDTKVLARDMEFGQSDVFETVEGRPPATQAQQSPAASALERARARSARVRWYLVASVSAFGGALLTVAVYRATGSTFLFISGFAMAVALAGGFGPATLAGIGSVVLGHLLLPANELRVIETDEIVRLVANTILIMVVSVLAGLFRRSRMATLEREARLERAAASVRELLDESSDAIALTDSDLRITYVNPRAETMFGFARGAAIGRTLQSIITPESLQRHPMQMGALSAGQTIRSDWTAFRADGSTIDIEISARLLKGGRLLASIRDMSDSKREAERQRTERDLMDGMLATSVAGVLMVDTDGEIVFANRRAEGILRLKKSTPTSRTYSKPTWKQVALDGGVWPRESQPFRQVVATGAPVFDVRFAIEWPDQRRVALSVNGAPLREASGALQGVVFAVNDISTALAAEQALRKSDRMLEQITDAMPGIVFQYVVDGDGHERFVFVSRFSEQLLGRTARQLLEGAESAWSMVHPDDLAPAKLALAQSSRTMAPWIHEFRIQDVHSAESWRWVSGQAVPQRGPEAGSVLWNGIFTDITDRKTLEDDLRQAQRIESIGRLAGGIAHDFNNLLTVIFGHAELLAMDLPADGPHKVGLEQIRTAAESGAALTRQLLGFARKQVGVPQILDVNELVRRVPPLVGRLIGESIILDLVLADAAPQVRVDPAQLDQVMVNLVVNARDAMPEGGFLEISTRVVDAETTPRSERALLPTGPFAEIRVRDSGTGMTTEVRDRAFEPFFTTKAVGQGTGLGLGTSYGIVSQWGGTILLESMPGHGTVVRVLLPITEDRASPVRSRVRSVTPTGHETILVVDDDGAVRSVTATALRRQGYRVLEAATGASALEQSRAERGRIHALVTDVAMPLMSGPALAAELVRERPDLRVLFVTGYANDGIAHHGILDDGVSLLQKPFDIRELAQRVRELLGYSANAAN